METYFDKLSIGTIFNDYEGNTLMTIGCMDVGLISGVGVVNAVVIKAVNKTFKAGYVVYCKPSEYVKTKVA